MTWGEKTLTDPLACERLNARRAALVVGDSSFLEFTYALREKVTAGLGIPAQYLFCGKEEIVKSGIAYAACLPAVAFRGFAWMNRPKTKRLRKKVFKRPQLYPRYAKAVYTRLHENVPPGVRMVWP